MWIKKIVEELISKYGTNDPYEIADVKKIYVFERNLDKDILGFYRYVRRNKFIYINSNLGTAEKRFTCAHELGHSEIHPKLNTPFLKRKTLFSVGEIEVEANRFAVELLMPDEFLYEYKGSNITIREVSQIYGIPEEICHFKKF